MNSRGIAGLAGLLAAGALATAGPAFGTATATFSNPTPITINDAVTSGVPVPASPYPSGLSVGPVAGRVTAVSLTLNGVTHTSPADVAVTLVGPNFRGALFGNAGGVTTPVSNATLSFISGGPAIPFDGPMVSGVFGPSQYSTTGTPAVSGLARIRYAAGPWSIYVTDDDPGDTGVIAGGFSVNVAYNPTNVFTTGAATLDKKKGTATLKVTVPNPGVITLAATKSVKGATLNVPAAGTYLVLVNAAGRSLKRLKKKNKVIVTASLQYTPNEGTPTHQSSVITLKTKKAKKKHKKHH